MSNVYVDIHAIQAVPPSNLNRDDTGSAKTAMFGGVRRARVSSQSWKKAMRDYFDARVRGTRTLNVPALISERIRMIDFDVTKENADKLALTALKSVGAKGITTGKDKDDDTEKLKALLFISTKQIDHIAHIMLGHDGDAEVDVKDKKELKRRITAALQEDNSIDMALFGRMVADDPHIDVDASAQVAHAISVNRVNPEFDFYTAVDDNSREDHAGSAMMGRMEFNSSVYYRYANVGLNQLTKNLDYNPDETVSCVKDFLRAFIESLPTGKQNTNAAQSLPSTVLVEIRNTRPVSYAGAFEKPVYPKNTESISVAADNALKAYADNLNSTYTSLKPQSSFVFSINPGSVANTLGEPGSESELIERVGNAVEEALSA